MLSPTLNRSDEEVPCDESRHPAEHPALPRMTLPPRGIKPIEPGSGPQSAHPQAEQQRQPRPSQHRAMKHSTIVPLSIEIIPTGFNIAISRFHGDASQRNWRTKIV